ncbi:hypothetical protein [Photobacterium leiognathi]|uniref:hypothetical protein n=1 Tax=Photobacterium leiognathi TaxID=553611 RepID=UPI0029814E41|nr:hypothetical protein [Photobacterium leiognathi]
MQGSKKRIHLSADDLSIGAMFIGDDAKALQTAIRYTLKQFKIALFIFIYHKIKEYLILEKLLSNND